MFHVFDYWDRGGFRMHLAGYLMEHGPLKVLMQPAELIIIGGAALGTVLISNPLTP
jgi:flagellar motor component MotA